MNKYSIINHATKSSIVVEANSIQEAARQVGCRIKNVSLVDIGQPKLEGMPISKAIEILTMATGGGGIATNPDYINAQKLGIEALKRHQAQHTGFYYTRLGPLPGETPD